MNQTNLAAALLNITLDRADRQPLFAQLEARLRRHILTGHIAAGTRLPSSRKFAEELSVSRVTVVTAYEQLLAEGYIESRPGAGVFVASGLPAAPVAQDRPATRTPKTASLPDMPKPFQPGIPDMTLFPYKQWAKTFQKVWAKPDAALLGNHDPLGFLPLRQQIADHLHVWRGIDCHPAQIIVTAGAGDSVGLLAEALLPKGAVMALENPGFSLFDQVLTKHQCQVAHIPASPAGLNVSALRKQSPAPNGVIITPSRQYPLGGTMPLATRLDLLKWLTEGGHFLIEDDYDSEYRYKGTPLPALASLAPQARVIYMGSFSKVFSKSLRLGYLVLPEKLVDTVSKSARAAPPAAAFLAQPVLAQFMQTGAYATHIRKMRRIYAARQKAFIRLARQHLGGLIDFSPADAGMHLVGQIGDRLPGKPGDVAIAKRAAKAGVHLAALSDHYAGENSIDKKQGLIAGYAGFDEAAMEAAIKKLAACL